MSGVISEAKRELQQAAKDGRISARELAVYLLSDAAKQGKSADLFNHALIAATMESHKGPFDSSPEIEHQNARRMVGSIVQNLRAYDLPLGQGQEFNEQVLGELKVIAKARGMDMNRDKVKIP